MTYVMAHLTNYSFDWQADDGKIVPCRATEFVIKTENGFGWFQVNRWPRSTKVKFTFNAFDKWSPSDLSMGYAHMNLNMARTSEYKKMARSAGKNGSTVSYVPVKEATEFTALYPGLWTELMRDPEAAHALNVMIGMAAPPAEPDLDWTIIEPVAAGDGASPPWEAAARPTGSSTTPPKMSQKEYRKKQAEVRNEAMFEQDAEWGSF